MNNISKKFPIKIIFCTLFFSLFNSYACAGPPREQVIIIGAGPSGLVAAKSALECNLEPLVLEKADTFGGLWKPYNGLTWTSLRTNISRYTTMFSDFPWSDSTELFPNQKDVYNYLKDYVGHFSLTNYIQFNSHVTKVKRKGKVWQVTWKQGNKTLNKEVKHIIIASGIFSKPFIPIIKGIKKFTGTILHSQNYRSPELFKNKKIVVIGGSFSGVEIAADLYQHAKQVVNVISRPIYILERYVGIEKNKMPLDWLFYKKPVDTNNISLSTQEKNLRSNQFLNKLCFKQIVTCKLPAPLPTSTDPTYVAISDDYLDGVQKGRILVTLGSIAYLDKNGLVFKNGQRQDADVIIFCTGYKLDLEFLTPNLHKTLSYDPNDQFQPILLHKLTFRPNLPNMAFVGVYRGPYFGIMELQARWACMIFSGSLDIPSCEVMGKNIILEQAIRFQKPRPQFPHGNYVELAEDLAREIGVTPDLDLIKKDDISLYNMLCTNPLIPSYYRINGPNSKPQVAISIIKSLHTLLQNNYNQTTIDNHK